MPREWHWRDAPTNHGRSRRQWDSRRRICRKRWYHRWRAEPGTCIPVYKPVGVRAQRHHGGGDKRSRPRQHPAVLRLGQGPCNPPREQRHLPHTQAGDRGTRRPADATLPGKRHHRPHRWDELFSPCSQRGSGAGATGEGHGACRRQDSHPSWGQLDRTGAVHVRAVRAVQRHRQLLPRAAAGQLYRRRRLARDSKQRRFRDSRRGQDFGLRLPGIRPPPCRGQP